MQYRPGVNFKSHICARFAIPLPPTQRPQIYRERLAEICTIDVVSRWQINKPKRSWPTEKSPHLRFDVR